VPPVKPAGTLETSGRCSGRVSRLRPGGSSRAIPAFAATVIALGLVASFASLAPAGAQVPPPPACFPVDVTSQAGQFTLSWDTRDPRVAQCPGVQIEGFRFRVQVIKHPSYCDTTPTPYIDTVTNASTFDVTVDQAGLVYEAIVSCNTSQDGLPRSCPIVGVDSFSLPTKPTLSGQAGQNSVTFSIGNLDDHTAQWRLLRATNPEGPFTEVCTGQFPTFCDFGSRTGAVNGSAVIRDYGPGCDPSAAGQLPDGLYYYKVSAENWGLTAASLSAVLPVQSESDVISVQVGTPCAPPAAPALTVNGVTNTTVTVGQPYQLAWTAVPGADSYQIYRSVDGEPFNAFGPPTQTTGLGFTTNAANAGHDYAYKIQSIIDCGESGSVVSADSNLVDVAVLCPTATAPRLTSSQSEVVGGESFLLSWNRTLNGAGHYVLKIQRDGQADQNVAITWSQTSYVVHTTSNDDGHRFTFSIQADPECEGGSASAFGEPVTVDVAPPITCTEAPPSPATAQIASLDEGPITGVDPLGVSWSAVDPPPDSYVWMLNGGEEHTVDGHITSDTAPPTAAEGRDPTASITLSVRAVNQCGESAPVLSTAVSPQPPVASFPEPTVDGLTVHFQDNSSPEATAWLWLYGDASPPTEADTGQTATHEYATAGRYNVWLIASNGAGSSLATEVIDVGLGAAATTTAAQAVVRPLDASNRRRQRLESIDVTGPNRSWLVLTSQEVVETIVFLHLRDSSGALVLERRLSIQPGQEARFDLSAYGLSGTLGLEVVSMQKFTAALEERPANRVISLVPGRGPTRREDPRE
jgi:PKD repeat protein